jgi:hypothetical protein
MSPVYVIDATIQLTVNIDGHHAELKFPPHWRSQHQRFREKNVTNPHPITMEQQSKAKIAAG